MRGDICVNTFEDAFTFTLVIICSWHQPQWSVEDYASKEQRDYSSGNWYNLRRYHKATCWFVDRTRLLLWRRFQWRNGKGAWLWDWVESKSTLPKTELKQIKTRTERELFRTPVILDHPDFIQYCKHPHDFKAEKTWGHCWQQHREILPIPKVKTCKTTAMLTFALRLSSMQYSLSRSIQEMWTKTTLPRLRRQLQNMTTQ